MSTTTIEAKPLTDKWDGVEDPLRFYQKVYGSATPWTEIDNLDLDPDLIKTLKDRRLLSYLLRERKAKEKEPERKFVDVTSSYIRGRVATEAEKKQVIETKSRKPIKRDGFTQEELNSLPWYFDLLSEEGFPRIARSYLKSIGVLIEQNYDNALARDPVGKALRQIDGEIDLEKKVRTKRIVTRHTRFVNPKPITPLAVYLKKYNGLTFDKVEEKDPTLAVELKKWGYVGLYIPSSKKVVKDSNLIYDPETKKFVRKGPELVDVTGHFIIIDRNSPKNIRITHSYEGTDLDTFSESFRSKIAKIPAFYKSISAFHQYIDDIFPCTQDGLKDDYPRMYEALKKTGCLGLVPSSLFEVSRMFRLLEQLDLVTHKTKRRLDNLFTLEDSVDEPEDTVEDKHEETIVPKIDYEPAPEPIVEIEKSKSPKRTYTHNPYRNCDEQMLRMILGNVYHNRSIGQIQRDDQQLYAVLINPNNREIKNEVPRLRESKKLT